MILATLVVGAVTAYWFGLRIGLWAAVATFVLCFVALFVPSYAHFIYLGLAAGVVGVFYVGSRRPRPPDAVLVTRWTRRTIGQAAGLLRGFLARQSASRRDAKRKDEDRRNRPN